MIDRRTALLGLGALPLVGAAVPPVPVPVPLRKPPRLEAGDTVALIEPAGFTEDRFDLDQTLATIRAMGLVPKPAPHVMKRYGYLAGTDKDRAADINAVYADKAVKAVFATRGGWGCARVLPYLDFTVIRANPKLLVGFSDVTALHLAFADRAGCPTIHGPGAAGSWGAASWDSFRRLAFLGEMPTWRAPMAAEDRLAPRKPIRTFRGGKASGRLLGGNLAVLSAMVGTPWMPDFAGAILFLEETGEAEYRLDRMLTQLGLSGVLGQVAGVVFGQCTRCTGEEANYSGFTVSEVFDQHFAPLGVPAFQGAPVGHIADQVSMPVGIRAEIDADEGTIRMLEPVVG